MTILYSIYYLLIQRLKSMSVIKDFKSSRVNVQLSMSKKLLRVFTVVTLIIPIASSSACLLGVAGTDAVYMGALGLFLCSSILYFVFYKL